MAELTPVMAQYVSIKEQHQDEVLFFRLGDFYEMFFDDAIEVSKLLNITLTHRAEAPMCGIPYHASKIYIARLLRAGKKIAICEQIGDPKAKGLTERKVVEIITPGNVIEEEYLDQEKSNFLAAICFVKGKKSTDVSYSYIDISTGDFYSTHWALEDFTESFLQELSRSTPKELLVSQSVKDKSDFQKIIDFYPTLAVSVYPDWHFSMELSSKALKNQFGSVTLHSFSLDDDSAEIASSGFLLEYLLKNSGFAENAVLRHITNLHVYSDNQFLMIDDSSKRNLEITANLHDGTSNYSLLQTVSYTCTPMGKRLLNSYFMYPLTDKAKIESRQNHVKTLFADSLALSKIREILSSIYDIERMAGKIALEKAHPKNIRTLFLSLKNTITLYSAIKNTDIPFIEIDTAQSLANLIDSAILEDPGTILSEGGYIKAGYSEQLDYWRNVHDNFNSILDEYLEEEKKNTGIQNLKIRYNSMMGYYFDVTKAQLSSVPSYFILRRALVNGERYTTPKLQELENELMKASEQILLLEKSLFVDLCSKIRENLDYLLALSKVVSYIDVISSFAYAAQIQNWVCPKIVSDGSLQVENGRHPVVEYHMMANEFVPNSVDLSSKKFALITGPNMAGKSTFLRQNALIVFLAQIGSFVPATKANISIVDKIFCRVGASDNLARGESTFLVEMSETALILRSATEKSLIIMDEVGRGTSTEDGLSLAWAICEYLLNQIRAKTLFATHYHQLTNLENENIQLLCMDVLEDDGKIIFLRKVKEGSAQNSYGIHVARLAGVPQKVVARAQEILKSISLSSNISDVQKSIPKVSESNLPGLFGEEELVLDEILSLDVNEITPLQALSKISQWKKNLMS